jgi:Flp pilus assembly protein TadD
MSISTPTLRPRSWLQRGALLLAVVLAAGCATAPPPPPLPLTLFEDTLFAPPATPVSSDTVFAMSPAMRAYAERHLAPLLRQADPRRALIEVMYQKSGLQLSYDATRTRSAAEAFEAREGNCLSLVIMTGAFARWLELPVSFQAVLTDETYSRSGSLTVASHHVNLVLSPPPIRPAVMRSIEDSLTVDFLPASELRGQRTRALEQHTIVAMYFNNRAAESLALGQVDQAYWLAREALRQDPGYVNAANTLGVIYLRAGHVAPAERALRHVIAQDRSAVNALSNLLPLLQRQGRAAEAADVATQLARLQPVPPFQRLEEGRQAMAAGNYEQASELFREELRLQPYQDEVHFWAAQAAWRLGRQAEAARHLAHARDYSLSRGSQARYSAKLEQLRASPRLQ